VPQIEGIADNEPSPGVVIIKNCTYSEIKITSSRIVDWCESGKESIDSIWTEWLGVMIRNVMQTGHALGARQAWLKSHLGLVLGVSSLLRRVIIKSRIDDTDCNISVTAV
jgi:hypothetical protein